jgi:hypothetical protein
LLPMRDTAAHQSKFNQPDYEYGNRPTIEVVRLVPNLGALALDPHSSLEIEHNADIEPLFTEEQLEERIKEIALNYRIIYDPHSSEAEPKQFGMSIANGHLPTDTPGILILSSGAASLYDEKGNVNTFDNALEMAYTSFKHPTKRVVYVEIPGNGNSVNLTDEEYAQAAKDGKLVHEKRDHSGKIVDYEAFETIQAMVRALEEAGVNITHTSANAAGAHFSTAVATALPENSLERAFLYNPTNISDRSWVCLSVLTLKEVATQRKYKKASKDPLKLTDERRDMAKRVMGQASKGIIKRRIQQAQASTHNLGKLSSQQKMFRRGNKHGQAAAVQLVAAQTRHKELRQTIVLPEFAAQYKDPKDFIEFMSQVKKLGGSVIEIADIESLSIPLGQYGHSHYPTVRQTLENYAFHR